MSWHFLYSAKQQVVGTNVDIKKIDLNINTPSIIILSCTSIEAFCNEISCFMGAYKDQYENNFDDVDLDKEQINAIIAFKYCKGGSFVDQYKKMLKKFAISNPSILQELHSLRKLRNKLVHFSDNKLSVIEDENGVIKYFQEPPEIFNHINKEYENYPVIVGDDSVEWSLRIATHAMAIWSIEMAIDAILHTLNSLPSGRYKDFILQKYSARNKNYRTVFEQGKNDLEQIKKQLFS